MWSAQLEMAGGEGREGRQEAVSEGTLTNSIPGLGFRWAPPLGHGKYGRPGDWRAPRVSDGATVIWAKGASL